MGTMSTLVLNRGRKDRQFKFLSGTDFKLRIVYVLVFVLTSSLLGGKNYDSGRSLKRSLRSTCDPLYFLVQESVSVSTSSPSTYSPLIIYYCEKE